MAHRNDDGDAALWYGHDGQPFVLASWVQHGACKFLERLEIRVIGRGVCCNLAVNTGSDGDDTDYSVSTGLFGQSSLRSSGNLGSRSVFSTIKPTQKVKNPAIDAVLVN